MKPLDDSTIAWFENEYSKGIPSREVLNIELGCFCAAMQALVAASPKAQQAEPQEAVKKILEFSAQDVSLGDLVEIAAKAGIRLDISFTGIP